MHRLLPKNSSNQARQAQNWTNCSTLNVATHTLEGHDSVAGWGGGKLHIHTSIFPSPIPPSLRNRRDVLERYEGEVIKLGATLLHEYVHYAEQGYVFGCSKDGFEREAWVRQRKFLLRIHNSRKGRSDSHLHEAIDNATRMIKEYGGANES